MDGLRADKMPRSLRPPRQAGGGAHSDAPVCYLSAQSYAVKTRLSRRWEDRARHPGRSSLSLALSPSTSLFFWGFWVFPFPHFWGSIWVPSRPTSPGGALSEVSGFSSSLFLSLRGSWVPSLAVSVPPGYYSMGPKTARQHGWYNCSIRYLQDRDTHRDFQYMTMALRLLSLW